MGETYTDDIKKIMESVRDNPVTIAKSANGPGKSHCAARIAVWLFKCFPGSQVYTCAAPPEGNLKRILWGEIGGIIEKHPALFKKDLVKILHIERSALSFLTGVAIPTSGSEKQREAKFCADADDLFEMRDGSVVRYGDLIGQKDVQVLSVDPQFKRQESLAEFFDNGMKPVWEIELEDGEVIRRTGNHPLYAGWDIKPDHRIIDGKHGKGRIRARQEGWVEVSNLKVANAVLCPDDTGFNFGSEGTDDNQLKFLAYMIGDGCFRGKIEKSIRLQFTQEDNAQRAEFLNVLTAMGATHSISDKKKYNWAVITINDQKLKDFIQKCGLAGKGSEKKFVPDFVNNLGKEHIALFLSRLFATDGWACVTNKAEIGYCSKSERLVCDIRRLLRRFGIRAKIIPKIISWDHNGESKRGLYWSLFICRAIDVIRFADKIGIYGKEDGVNACREYSMNRQWVYGNWKFEKPGYRWGIINSIRAIGDRPTVGVHVPENQTYLTSLVEHNSGKHAPYLLFIVDEGDAVPDEVYRGIESCMSGGIMARLLVMFNPRAEMGAVYRMERDKKAKIISLSAFNHPNVISGENRIPGAVTREAVVRRINEWCRPLLDDEKVDSECFRLPEFLEGAVAKSQDGYTEYLPLKAGHYKIMEPSFSYMVLGAYPAKGSNQLISKEWVNQARFRWDAYVREHGEKAPPHTPGVMGLDLGEFGTDPSVLCTRYGGYVERMIQWSGLDPVASAEKAVTAFKNKTRIYSCNCDADGIGSGAPPTMQRAGCSAYPVKASFKPTETSDMGVFCIMRDQLWWACREWLRTDPGAMLPPDDELIEELLCPTYEIPGGEIRVMKKDLIKEHIKRSPNKADALCLTFYSGGFFSGCDLS